MCLLFFRGRGLGWVGSWLAPEVGPHGRCVLPSPARLGCLVSQAPRLLTTPAPHQGAGGREISPCLCVFVAHVQGGAGGHAGSHLGVAPGPARAAGVLLASVARPAVGLVWCPCPALAPCKSHTHWSGGSLFIVAAHQPSGGACLVWRGATGAPIDMFAEDKGALAWPPGLGVGEQSVACGRLQGHLLGQAPTAGAQLRQQAEWCALQGDSRAPTVEAGAEHALSMRHAGRPRTRCAVIRLSAHGWYTCWWWMYTSNGWMGGAIGTSIVEFDAAQRASIAAGPRTGSASAPTIRPTTRLHVAGGRGAEPLPASP